MTDPKIETVQSIYEAFGRGDIEFILDQLTEDVDWESCPDSDVAPWRGIHRGRAEVPAFFKELGSTLQITAFTPLSFTSNEADVMVVTHWAATARPPANLPRWTSTTGGASATARSTTTAAPRTRPPRRRC
jgi:ketosteroid isomerase-like protein